MKMKNFLKIALLSVMTVSAIGAAACSGGKDDKGDGAKTGRRVAYEQEQELYDKNYREEWVKANANPVYEGITVDGKVDEAVWNGLGWQTWGQYRKTINFTLTYNENGIFWAMKSKDSGVFWNFTNSPEGNTSFELLVSTADDDSTSPQNYSLQIRQDTSDYCMSLHGRSPDWQDGWDKIQRLVYHKWSLIGEGAELNESNMEGLMMEGFIDWSAIGYDVSAKGLPEKIKIFPQYNYQDSKDKSSRVDYIRPQAFYNRARSWYYFDEKGYINGDNRIAEEYPDAILGDGTFTRDDYSNVLAKTAAWDFSEAASGKYSLKKAYDTQWIFFKNVSAQNYVIKTKIKYDGQRWGASTARLGIISGMYENGASYSPFNALVWGVGSNTSSKVSYINFNSKFMTNTWSGQLGPNGGQIDKDSWTSLGEDYGNLSTSSEVELAVVKRDNVLVYFVNGRYWTSVTNDSLKGATVPGLYAYNCEGTFSDVSCSTSDADIDDMLEKSGLYTINLTKTQNYVDGEIYGKVYDIGGTEVSSFTTSTLVPRGYTVKVSVKAVQSSIFVSALEKLTADGADVTDRITDGVYEFTVTGMTNVNATFRNVEKANVRKLTAETTKTDAKLVIYAYGEDGFENYKFTYEATTSRTTGNAVLNLGLGYYKIVLSGDEQGAKYVSITADGIYETDRNGNPVSSDPITNVSFS